MPQRYLNDRTQPKVGYSPHQVTRSLRGLFSEPSSVLGGSIVAPADRPRSRKDTRIRGFILLKPEKQRNVERGSARNR